MPKPSNPAALILLAALAACGDTPVEFPPDPCREAMVGYPAQETPTGAIRHVHDPEIVKGEDAYYVLSTNDGVPIRRSTDLMRWELLGRVFQDPPYPGWRLRRCRVWAECGRRAWPTSAGGTTCTTPCRRSAARNLTVFRGRIHLRRRGISVIKHALSCQPSGARTTSVGPDPSGTTYAPRSVS